MPIIPPYSVLSTQYSLLYFSKSKTTRQSRKQIPRKYTYRPVPEREWHWTYTLMIIGLFFGLASLGWAGRYTFLTWLELSQVLAFCCFIGMIIPWKYYKKWWGLRGVEVLFFNLFAIGPILCGLLLWTNYLIPTEIHKEVYEIQRKKEHQRTIISNAAVFFQLENDALEEFPQFRKFEIYDEETLRAIHAKKIEYTIGKGLLGVDVLRGRRLME